MQDIKNQKKLTHSALPDPESFRIWLKKALFELGLKPSSYGLSLGLGRNTLGQFLQGESRDLRLGTASTLTKDLQEKAIQEGKVLAELEGIRHA
tara:strand:- start:979 stop:1260 length:282 start_codon:yes stop_codon:yes gene_type:complete